MNLRPFLVPTLVFFALASALAQNPQPSAPPATQPPASTPANPAPAFKMPDPDSPPERAEAILKEGLASRDYTVRVQAVTALSMVGRTPKLTRHLAAFLDDKNVQVRLAAVQALGDQASASGQAALEKALDDPTPEVSFSAARVLVGLHNAAGTDALMDVFDRERKGRSGLIKKEERSVMNEFHSAPSAMIFIVRQGVGYVPLPGVGEGFSAISALVKDPGFTDRAQVVFLVCQKKTPQTRELLRKALHDEEWSVRAAAAQMVAHTAQFELRDELLPLFDDKNQKVRFRAAGAYLHLIPASQHQHPGALK